MPKYTVTGRGEFPQDMLRYDRATFATPYDAAVAGKGYVHGPVRQVQVITEGTRLTHGRWQSFNWRVMGDSETTLADTVINSMRAKLDRDTSIPTYAGSAPAPTTLNIKDLEALIKAQPEPQWMLVCPDGTLLRTSKPRELLLHLMRTCPVELLFPQGGEVPHV